MGTQGLPSILLLPPKILLIKPVVFVKPGFTFFRSGVGDPACLCDDQGRTPLHVLAASPQSTSVTVRQLLQAASLSGSESILEARDNEGRTCLHYSALGSSDTMECLLDAGAALDARDSKMRTALHYAAGKAWLQ